MQTTVELGVAQRLEVAGIALFGLTTDSNGRKLVNDLCTWQERWHDRLARIERLVGIKVTLLEA